MAILLSFALCVLFVGSSLFTVADQQIPLLSGHDESFDLIHELKKAEIIPTVLDTFIPLLTVNVTWEDASAEYGNTIKVSHTRHQPKVKLIDSKPSIWSSGKVPQLTIAISDPDAPSRDNPKWSEVCHWISTDISVTKPDGDDDEDEENHMLKKRQLDVMPYKPPGPPPKTGKHRYVFAALVPKNGTTDELNLRKPDGRRRWGFEHERSGLRMWAEEMGLEVIGANFIYEQDKEQ